MFQITNKDLILPDGKVLLQKMSLSIPKGKVTHLRGRNGVGKSSFIKSLLHIDSYKLDNTKFQYDYFYLPQMDNKEFLIPLQLSDISTKGEKLKWNLASGGERKRALLERALSSTAKLVILDEPFNHLDGDAIKFYSSEIEKKVLEQDKTIILISHRDPEIEAKLLHIVDLNQWSS
jgi:ABC-type multidrug transport system ATPase subunit